MKKELTLVYDTTPGGMFLFYRPANPGEPPVWIWDEIDRYEPVEVKV